MRERESRLEKRGRGHRRRGKHPAGACEAERRRDPHVLGMVHGRVEGDDSGEELRVIDRPSERDDPAPVVPERDDRAVERESLGEVGEIFYALRQRPRRAGARRESHIELVDGDHAPGRVSGLRGTERFRHQATPEVRPGRVAVHGQDRADRFHPDPLEFARRVEVMPLAQRIRVSFGNEGGAAAADIETRQARKHPLPGVVHQATSIMAVLRPEPTPMSSTRSPLRRLACSSTSVMGTEAGPMLP